MNAEQKILTGSWPSNIFAPLMFAGLHNNHFPLKRYSPFVNSAAFNLVLDYDSTRKPASKTERNFMGFFNSPFHWYINWQKTASSFSFPRKPKERKTSKSAASASSGRLPYYRLTASPLAARTSCSQPCLHAYYFQSEMRTQISQHLRFRDHDTINCQHRTPFFSRISFKLKCDSCIFQISLCHKDLFPAAYLHRTRRSMDTSVES